MSILLIKSDNGKTFSLRLSGWKRFVIPGCLLGVPLLFGMWLGNQTSAATVQFFLQLNAALEQELEEQQTQLLVARTEAEQKLRGMSIRLADLQARLIRMEALGEHITTLASLNPDEFDFSASPAVGSGSTSVSGLPVNDTSLITRFNLLEDTLEERQFQLTLLNDLLMDRNLQEQSRPSGLPVEKGWISSRYGSRMDPFTGLSTWHNGVDIPGKEGSPVLAVASGVVSNVEEEPGLGRMVEITHDGGYVTRYGHNSEIKVTVGDLVMRGDIIASMGSTGRATGSHVHLEVYKNGRSVDPASYIQRNIR